MTVPTKVRYVNTHTSGIIGERCRYKSHATSQGLLAPYVAWRASEHVLLNVLAAAKYPLYVLAAAKVLLNVLAVAKCLLNV
jgi:hypothetical protein